MNFTFTEEQSMLRDLTARFLATNYTFRDRQMAVHSESGWRATIWRAFAEELQILGACFAEKYGGLGGGPLETMILMEEFGKALVLEPYLSTVVIGGGFLKHGDNPRAVELIGEIIAGTAIFAFAHAEPHGRYNLSDLKTTARRDGESWVLNGKKAVVVGAPWATHLIVTARTAGAQTDREGVSVFIVEKTAVGVTMKDYLTIDESRASEVLFENVWVPGEAIIGPEGAALPLVERVVDEALAATAAEAGGVMRRMYEDTVAYAKQRKQFGQPISQFQVLQHRIVDMFIHLEQSISMTHMATLKLDSDNITRGKAISATKVQVGKACKFVGQNAVQLHGGIGITDELALSHYFRRSTMIESAFGSVDYHLSRYEALTFGEPV